MKLNLANFILISLLTCLPKQANFFWMLPNYSAEQFQILINGAIVFDFIPYFIVLTICEKSENSILGNFMETNLWTTILETFKE